MTGLPAEEEERRAAIVGPVRTAVGVFGGALRPVTSDELCSVVIRALVERTLLDPARIDEVVVANSYASSEAPCIARYAALKASLPIELPGYTLDRRCGSWLQAVSEIHGSCRHRSGGRYRNVGPGRCRAVTAHPGADGPAPCHRQVQRFPRRHLLRHAKPEYADCVGFSSYCGAGANRILAKAGKLDILPCHYSQLPEMIARGSLKIDVLARIERFVAINSAVEVDLTGQINTGVAGGIHVGAVGGALDFLRGAHRSKGGLPVVALPSTAGTASRIVSRLNGPVTTPRSDAGLIVTEYGIADLRGLPLSQRVGRMIAVAHPDFREKVARESAGIQV